MISTGKMFTSVQACWDVYEASVKDNPSTESSTEAGSDEDLPGLYTSAGAEPDPTPSQPEVNEPAGGETDEDSDEDSLEVRARRKRVHYFPRQLKERV